MDDKTKYAVIWNLKFQVCCLMHAFADNGLLKQVLPKITKIRKQWFTTGLNSQQSQKQQTKNHVAKCFTCVFKQT